jgi:outer membrane protein assembly factor BamB
MDDNLEGKNGARLLAVDTASGKVLSTTTLSSPPTWDGLTAAQGKLFVSTLSGRLQCLASE